MPAPIEDRTYQFALSLIRLYRKLGVRDDADRTVWRQLLKAGTSIGANSAEGPGTQSRELTTRHRVATTRRRPPASVLLPSDLLFTFHFSLPQRQLHHKLRPSLGSVGGRHGSSHHLHEVLDDGEAEAGAAWAGARFVYSVEAFEDAGEIVWWRPGPRGSKA